MIHYTVDLLAALIGPLYGIILMDYFVVRKQQIDVDALYTEDTNQAYWYDNGVNKKAVYALLIAGVSSVITSFIITDLANFSLFISGGVAAIAYKQLMSKETVMHSEKLKLAK